MKEKVAKLHSEITRAIGDAPLFERQAQISENSALAEFWKRFIDITLPGIDFIEIRKRYQSFYDAAISLAQQKEKSPTNQIIIDESFKKLMDHVEDLRCMINTYNTGLLSCNEFIALKKKEVQQVVNVEPLKKEHAMLEAQKKRYDPVIITACNQYKTESKAKEGNERLKENTRKKLDQYCSDMFVKYQASVNQYLELFNTGFRLDKTKHDYIGQTPRAIFQIQINKRNIDLASKSSAQPTFKTALSSGDKSAMAFAFFLSLLKQDKNASHKIVIFDDPFNSQDNFRRTCTQQKIALVATHVKQVIVFSHDPNFLKVIKDEVKDGNVKTLLLVYEDNKSCLRLCDIDEEVRSGYSKSYYKLHEYNLNQKGGLPDVARSIRPFLEGWLRSHYPGQFQDNEWLGDFIAKIRSATVNDGLSHSKLDLEELSEINNYSKNYHHEPSDTIDKGELLGYVKRTLRLTGNLVDKSS